MKECLFCRAQKENINTYITENETFFAVYDGHPVTKGHCLLIPKEHVESFFDLSEKQVKDFYELVKKMKENIQRKFNPDGFNIGINEGKAAGRTVDHLHIHLIPRYKGDVENPIGGVRNVIPGRGDYTKNV
jgi:diadenosine tetraphosphate (Ap4A) HIT family hydrolase